MGKLGDWVCYVCLKENLKVRSLSEMDEGRMTYKEMLIYCVPNTLEGFEDAFICENCTSLLRSAYKLISMVVRSQEYLKLEKMKIGNKESDATIIKVEEEINVDSPDLNGVERAVPQVADKTNMLQEKHTNGVCNDKSECVKLVNNKNNTHSDCDRVKSNGVKSEFVCKVCNTKLKTRSLLEKHFSRSHSITKRHECAYCHKLFKQSWHLQDHLSSHKGDKKFRCIICDKTFLRSWSLRRHYKTHERAPGEKVKPTPFLCTVCGKKFLYSNGLQRHMRVHLGIKSHECDVCKRKFSQRTHLLAHMRTHTGEKPYVCDTCGEAFSLNASLRKHMGTHMRDNVKIEYNCC